MKKLFSFCLLVALFGCKNERIINECFQNIKLNEIIYLENPEFINLSVPGGTSTTFIGGRKILIIRRTNSQFKAFDLSCPEGNCNNTMRFDGLKLICPCNKKEYNSINGMPIDGEGCSAIEYTTQVNGNTLIITR